MGIYFFQIRSLITYIIFLVAVWIMTPVSLAGDYQRFGETRYLHLLCRSELERRWQQVPPKHYNLPTTLRTMCHNPENHYLIFNAKILDV
jgi:hypothetical protein